MVVSLGSSGANWRIGAATAAWFAGKAAMRSSGGADGLPLSSPGVGDEPDTGLVDDEALTVVGLMHRLREGVLVLQIR
jgi:hypothetical protein